ncbi:Hypothetical predicted protein [Pelobates cultripes]|uniref:Uncharacterized protein n=1 Tax=Pelobates cultripes TaxID=61616 RepID=A0AAD1RQH4_PELCU|nr:Hypothetical predicted protein [Pelobates cultripes]
MKEAPCEEEHLFPPPSPGGGHPGPQAPEGHPTLGPVGVIPVHQRPKSTHLWDTSRHNAVQATRQGPAKMADGAAAKLMQQTNEEWAAALNVNFNAVCQRFWERMRERTSHPVQTPATTAARRHTPPRKQAKHPCKALPLKERAQGTVARWWKRRRGTDRPKITHYNQAKTPMGGSCGPPSTRQGHRGPQQTKCHNRNESLRTSTTHRTANTVRTDLKGGKTKPPVSNPANDGSRLQPGPGTPQLNSTRIYETPTPTADILDSERELTLFLAVGTLLIGHGLN